MRKKISQIPDNLTPEEHIADERQPVPIVPIPPEEEANVAAELPVSQTEPVAPPPEPVAAPEEPPAMPPVVPMGGQPLVPPPVVPVGGQPLIPPPFVPVGQPPIPGGQIPRPPYVSPPPAPPYPGAYNFPKPPFAVAFDEASAGANQSGLLAVIVFLFSVCYAELLVRTGLFLWNGVGFGIAVITALFYVAFTGIILRGGKKVKASSFLPLIPLAMLLFTFCINSSMWGRNIGIAAAVFLFIWQTTLMSGATNHPAFSFRAVGDALRTHFSYPLFSNMGASLKVAFGGGKKKDEKNNVPGRI
ncbi:MAG: hypothetical protein FWE86_01535, partial [Oscillospiraceae bacterium]|nr:hypothetical protein [Oscillospiraceae bacterium]